MTNFVIWSSTTSTALKPSQVPTLRMDTPLAGPVEIFGAAAADLGMRRIRPDVCAIMPAALALFLLAGTSHDLRRTVNDLGLRGIQYESQVIAERIQQRKPFAVGMDHDFRLQGRSDLARSPE